MFKLRNNQQGVVSFFTVIFVSILLIVMTTAFIRLMISSQRQATDNDLSTRAYYAAEAGVDDALVELKDAVNTSTGEIDETLLASSLDSCDSQTLSNGFDTSYTCKFISLNSPSETGLTDSVASGQSTNIDLFGVDSPIDSLRLQWHLPGEDGRASDTVNESENIPQSTWVTNKIPALIRFQVIQYPTSAISSFVATSGTNITNDITFTYPNNGFPQDISISDPVSSGSCNVNEISDYVCSATYNGFDTARNIFIRLKAINNSTHFKLVAFDSAGDEVALNPVATIDVTGRAGDVFRRVRVQVPINITPGSGDPELLPDQALLVDTDICKKFEVDPITNLIIDGTDACI